jgi:hypothetical protein
MPEILDGYIDKFGVLISTLKLQLCMCSYKDNLQIGFTSAFLSTDIQKNFFRELSSQGVNIEIRTNDYYSPQPQNLETPTKDTTKVSKRKRKESKRKRT